MEELVHESKISKLISDSITKKTNLLNIRYDPRK